jgi:hypothetical protein
MPLACSKDKTALSWPALLDFRKQTHEKQIPHPLRAFGMTATSAFSF